MPAHGHPPDPQSLGRPSAEPRKDPSAPDTRGRPGSTPGTERNSDARGALLTDLETIRTRLAARTYRPTVLSSVPRRAAVAAILRGCGHDSEVLLIRRAEKVGDPWSGHMAFPGGHQEPHDPALLDTALRETHEEIGLDLRVHGEHIGRLDDLEARARGQFVGMVVSPFVFCVRGAPSVHLNGEVAEVVWAPLGAMARGEIDTVCPYPFGESVLELPAYRVGQHVVWGMTYQMLQSLFDAVGLRPPGQPGATPTLPAQRR